MLLASDIGSGHWNPSNLGRSDGIITSGITHFGAASERQCLGFQDMTNNLERLRGIDISGNASVETVNEFLAQLHRDFPDFSYNYLKSKEESLISFFMALIVASYPLIFWGSNGDYLERSPIGSLFLFFSSWTGFILLALFLDNVLLRKYRLAQQQSERKAFAMLPADIAEKLTKCLGTPDLIFGKDEETGGLKARIAEFIYQ